MKKRILALVVILLVTFPLLVLAHSGRTDSNGGHYNRKTGEYHYHNGGTAYNSSSSSSYGQPSDVVSIYKVQTRLNELGYNCGTPDGVKGPRTIEAIKQFQRDNGLTADGIVGNQTRAALKI